jgi:hypothetical protein
MGFKTLVLCLVLCNNFGSLSLVDMVAVTWGLSYLSFCYLAPHGWSLPHFV